MKFLLIREKNTFYRYANTSYGLGIIGTMVKDIATVRILDNNARYRIYSPQDITAYIKDFQPDIIGFSINYFNFFESSQLIQTISRLFPHIILIAGGLHTYSDPREVAQSGIHIVVKEDAEMTIKPLLTLLTDYIGNQTPFSLPGELADKLKTIPGLFYFLENQTAVDTGAPILVKDLDLLPFVDYDLFNLEDFIKRPDDERFVTNILVTQRGCPFNCSFCQGKPNSSLRKFKENSAHYKVQYIKYLHEKYRVNTVVFYDNNFTLDRGNTMDFCREVIAEGMDAWLSFSCQTNVVVPLDDELAGLLKRAGCTEVGLGIERLSPIALEKINKNKDYDCLKNNIDMFKKHHISIMANCLVGFPFDTEETIATEKRLFSQIIDAVDTFAVNVLFPLPGTNLHEATGLKLWYRDKRIMSWKPSFYHLIYNFYNPAWDINFFNLDPATQKAIRRLKEFFYDETIRKVQNPVVTWLHRLEKICGSISLFFYRLSPRLEQILFFMPKFLRLRLWNYFVAKYHTKKK